MIDITTVTQVNSRWIFTKNGERIKSTAENVRDVWEQAKIKHMMYNIVIDDLSPVRDNMIQMLEYYINKSKDSTLDECSMMNRAYYKSLANEYLNKIDGYDTAVDFLRTQANTYYIIEAQAHNVMHVNRW